jgi:hypothetical protein
LLDVATCCDTAPDCAGAVIVLDADEDVAESSDCSLESEVEAEGEVVLVVAVATDLAADLCAVAAMQPVNTRVAPTLAATAALRLRRAGWGRGRRGCVVTMPTRSPPRMRCQ